MRFYIASGLDNRERVKTVIERLTRLGHTISYDWTEHGDVRERGLDVLTSIASSEVFGVIDAECVLLMLPGGKGTHTELGLALASRSNKRIYLWSETGMEFHSDKNTCAFYHHPSIQQLTLSFEELLAFLDGLA